MRPAPAIVLALLLSGCLSGSDQGPAIQVTPLDREGWNQDGRFRVVSEDGSAIQVSATSTEGKTVSIEGVTDVTLDIPDGTWTITYRVDGRLRGTLRGIQIDASPPLGEGLEFAGDADEDGSYRLGAGYVPEPGVTVQVADVLGLVVASALPVQLTGLTEGLHELQVRLTDPAGNELLRTVHVRAGLTRSLPEGEFDFGIVARYTAAARVWDIDKASASRSEAQAAVDGKYLGAGWGVTPADPAVVAVVEAVVTDDMDTTEAALALFKWFTDELEYDESQLEGSASFGEDTGNLLLPSQVLGDTEDAQRRDDDGDGFADDGPGNGVKGGVCRDLAATYVSLLRAAGVPARLVSGYLDGQVDGFHAWAEYYAGQGVGEAPWVPVDVSLIDGPSRPELLVQAFGFERPDYLGLRALPPEPERRGWSTAVKVAAEWPSNEDQPDVRLRKDVVPAFDDEGVLCFDPVTLRRGIADAVEQCPTGLVHYLPGIVIRSERTIDYGVDVRSAPDGATVTVALAYPFPDTVAPDEVLYRTYGAESRLDAKDGRVEAVLRF